MKMTIKEKPKSIVVLGSGGHGWQSIKEVIDYVEKNNTTIKFFYTPSDWGGSTGTIGRVFLLRDNNLNKMLHGTQLFPILPFGDINKIIGVYIEQKFPDGFVEINEKKVPVLSVRSDSHQVLMRGFIQLVKIFDLKQQFAEEFEQYIRGYLDYFLEFRDTISSAHTTSLGNIWHSFLYFKCQSMKKVCEFYYNNHTLPTHVQLEFTSENRQILAGTYIDSLNQERHIEGEDLIDEAEYPILPESLVLKNTTAKQSTVSDVVIDAVRDADLVIIPNGSVANWMPLLNYKPLQTVIAKKSAQQKIIWIMNLFHEKNEYMFDVYYHHLMQNNIHPTILAPQSIPTEYYVNYLFAYQKEGKTLNYNLNTQVHSLSDLKPGFNNCLEVITSSDDAQVVGVKYDRSSVCNSIQHHLSLQQVANFQVS
jgi:hypothetical protein